MKYANNKKLLKLACTNEARRIAHFGISLLKSLCLLRKNSLNHTIVKSVRSSKYRLLPPLATPTLSMTTMLSKSLPKLLKIMIDSKILEVIIFWSPKREFRKRQTNLEIDPL